MKGYGPNKEERKKISGTLMGHKVSNETKRKISNSHIGIKQTEESKIKIGLASKGRKFSLETKKKLSLAKIRDKHPNWLGGKSFEPYTLDWNETLKRSIRERDHYICQMPRCNKQQLERTHHIHHIDYDKKNCNPDNLITLCHSCHTKTNFNRGYWIKYFKELNK